MGGAGREAGLGLLGPLDEESVERRLAAAVRHGAFEVHYQPVLEVPSGRLIGVDASAHWPGAAPDDRERASVIAEVVRHVLAQLAGGPAAVGHWWVRVDVGLGPLVDRVLAHAIDEAERMAAVVPGRLRIGVREGDLALALVAGGVDHLVGGHRQLDVAHFGAGRLSASALRQVPAATVRVRVDAMAADDPADVAMLRTLVEIAGELDVDVVAEGVDTDAHLALVAAARIRAVQGFRWGTPGPLSKVLESWGRRP
jgi:EAL domain-containing protein (putative c-di-GMP-specific phosphodiesterase class I)